MLLLVALGCLEPVEAPLEAHWDFYYHPLYARPVAFNDPLPLAYRATGPAQAPELMFVWEHADGSRFPGEPFTVAPWRHEETVENHGYGTITELYGGWGETEMAVVPGMATGEWSLLLTDARGEVEFDREDEIRVGDWGLLEDQDPVELLPLGQPLVGDLRLVTLNSGPVFEPYLAPLVPVFELASLDGDQLTWRLSIWNLDWEAEGIAVPACRMLDGQATLTPDGRFQGTQPQQLNTMSGGEQFYLYDLSVEGGVGSDGSLGGLLLTGAVDMSLFEQWSDEGACDLLAGFGDDCYPCTADPERPCLDLGVRVYPYEPITELPPYEELPWCSAADEDIPSLDWDLPSWDCGCASGGQQGGAGLVLLALFGLLRRRK